MTRPLITCITPTGDRPEAFELCRDYMGRQTFKDFEWVIVDDGKTPLILPTLHKVDIIQAEPKEENTLGRNLLLGLEVAKGEYIAFIEDDDWYSAKWLVTAIERLSKDKNLLAYGEGCAKYYNVELNYYRQMSNAKHASLCQTVIHSSLNELSQDIVKNIGYSPFFDIPLWGEIRKMGTERYFLEPQSSNVVGIKGMPGRLGIGSGHRVDVEEWQYDSDLSILQSWVGQNDMQQYKSYMRRHAS